MSKRRRKIIQRIPDHDHCEICGLSIKSGERFCSEKCRSEFERAKKRRSMMDILILAGMSVIFVVFVLLPLLASLRTT